MRPEHPARTKNYATINVLNKQLESMTVVDTELPKSGAATTPVAVPLFETNVNPNQDSSLTEPLLDVVAPATLPEVSVTIKPLPCNIVVNHVLTIKSSYT